MSDLLNRLVFNAQQRIARKGDLSVLDVDPVRVRSLVAASDPLEFRRMLRSHGIPLMRHRYTTLTAGKPAWYLV